MYSIEYQVIFACLQKYCKKHLPYNSNLLDVEIELYRNTILVIHILVSVAFVFFASTNPAHICWSSRRLQDVFKTCLKDVFNMPLA